MNKKKICFIACPVLAALALGAFLVIPSLKLNSPGSEKLKQSQNTESSQEPTPTSPETKPETKPQQAKDSTTDTKAETTPSAADTQQTTLQKPAQTQAEPKKQGSVEQRTTSQKTSSKAVQKPQKTTPASSSLNAKKAAQAKAAFAKAKAQAQAGKAKIKQAQAQAKKKTHTTNTASTPTTHMTSATPEEKPAKKGHWEEVVVDTYALFRDGYIARTEEEMEARTHAVGLPDSAYGYTIKWVTKPVWVED